MPILAVVVRAARAAANTIGDGRYPSSEQWCSEREMATHPRVSAQAAMSSAARIRSGADVAANEGWRRSKRTAHITMSVRLLGCSRRSLTGLAAVPGPLHGP